MAIKKHKSKLTLFIATVLCWVLPLQTAWAEVVPLVNTVELINSACPVNHVQQYQELNELKQQIMAAETIAKAQAIALSPTDEAIGALENARSLISFSDDLRSAEARLNDFRSRILVASSQEQVANEFDGMMLAGLDNDNLAKVSVGHSSCSYSTGETIAIVLGLILGIIPGLILLAVLC